MEEYQEGNVTYCDVKENGDIHFETDEQGICLIHDGQNIMEEYQEGKSENAGFTDNGDFFFETEKQGFILISNGVNICSEVFKIKQESAFASGYESERVDIIDFEDDTGFPGYKFVTEGDDTVSLTYEEVAEIAGVSPTETDDKKTTTDEGTGEVVEEAEIQTSSGEHRVVRRDSGQIQVFNLETGEKEVARPILIQFSDENSIEFDRKKANTRVIGKKVLDWVREH